MDAEVYFIAYDFDFDDSLCYTTLYIIFTLVLNGVPHRVLVTFHSSYFNVPTIVCQAVAFTLFATSCHKIWLSKISI